MKLSTVCRSADFPMFRQAIQCVVKRRNICFRLIIQQQQKEQKQCLHKNLQGTFPLSLFKVHLYIAAGRGEGKGKWKRLLHLMVQH